MIVVTFIHSSKNSRASIQFDDTKSWAEAKSVFDRNQLEQIEFSRNGLTLEDSHQWEIELIFDSKAKLEDNENS